MEERKKYTVNEEITNVVTHAVALVVCVVVCTYFFVCAAHIPQPTVVPSLILYAFGLFFSYSTSVSYHAIPSTHVRAKALLRKFDHAAIYWHIAGCYSPVALIALLQSGAVEWGWAIFIFIWVSAIAGTAVSFRKMSNHSYIETACYLLMGLTILVAIKPFYDAVGMGVIAWVIAEGVSYISGAVLYSIHKVRYMHSIFHSLIFLGDIFHMIALWKILQIYCI